MDWIVKNAINRDVERQHLNKILKEIKTTADSLSSRVGAVGDDLTQQKNALSSTITRIVNREIPAEDLITNVTLTGDVTGTSVTVAGSNAVVINTQLQLDFAEQSPNDETAYWRRSQQWEAVPPTIDAFRYIEGSGIGVWDDGELQWLTRTIESASTDRIVVDNGDGILGNPSIDLALLPNTGVGEALYKITRDDYGRVEGTEQAVASDLPVDYLPGATYTNVQDVINILHSPGLVTGGLLSSSGSNVVVAAGTIAIRPIDDNVSTLYMANFSGASIPVPNDSLTRFIGVVYNAGSPVVEMRTAFSWDLDTDIPLGTVVNIGGTLFPFSNPFKVGDPITNIIQRFDADARAIRDASVGGLILGETGVRNVTLTAGRIWSRLNDYDITAKNSSTTPMLSVRPNAGGSALIFGGGITQWPNDLYADVTTGTLVTMGNNKWANLWFFTSIESGAWGFAYGTAEYNTAAAAALEALPAYLTANFLNQTLLVGRFIFEKGAATASIESAFNMLFGTEVVSIHNNLSGLQGGQLNEYYHLTQEEHDDLSSLVPVPGVDGVVYGRKDGVWSPAQPLASNLTILSASSYTPEIDGKNLNLTGSDATEISLGVKNIGGGTAVFHYYYKSPTTSFPENNILVGGAGSRPWAGTDFSDHSTAAYHLVTTETHSSSSQGTDFRILATPIGGMQSDRIYVANFNGDGDIINSKGLTDRKVNSVERGRGFEIVRDGIAAEFSMISTLPAPFTSLFRGYAVGGTIASPSATGASRGCGYALCGHDGSSYVGAKALVGMLSTATWSSSSTPTNIFFETTQPGSTSRTTRWYIGDTGNFYPATDNAYSVGTSSLRPSQIYAVNGTINTSDARLKTEPRDITSDEISAFLTIARLPMVWRWLHRVEEEGDGARLHSGPTVQAAIAIMEAHGLEWSAYSAFCYDEWPELQEETVSWEDEYDEHGVLIRPAGNEVVQEYRAAGNRYSFRREELLWWTVRAQASKLDDLEARVVALEGAV